MRKKSVLIVMNENESTDVSLQSRKMRKRQINRETILIYAEKEFLEKGYENARVEDIAFNSGNSKATIYNYFDSKEDLLTAIIAKSYQLYKETLITDLNLNENKNIFKIIVDSYFNFDKLHAYYSELLFSNEAIFSIKKIYDKIVKNEPLTESEQEYKNAEAETVSLYVEIFTKYLNKTNVERKDLIKLIQAFAQFGLTIREVIMRGKLMQRSTEETMELLDTIIKIIELGIKNFN